ncbi:MAG: phosphoribosylformylglycinamidine synthase [Firmicutes bacterium]|nr:phosphoribosylformylglycinamidine synthase [Bacillota bacterium]
MDSTVKRVFVEKKPGYDIEAQSLARDLKQNLGIAGLQSLRIINRYDVQGLSDEEFQQTLNTVFAEPPVDRVYLETLPTNSTDRVLAVEYLPGQYDQRADSAAQCIQLLTQKERPEVKTAKVIVMTGISEAEFERVRSYCINPIECREASLEKPATLETVVQSPEDIKTLNGFIGFTRTELEGLLSQMGLAMSLDDLLFCQAYFRDTERRDPTLTEIRVIDTYWSDHCRHTTFLTAIDDVSVEPGAYSSLFNSVYHSYLDSRRTVYQTRPKNMCLMDLATIAMKELRLAGKLPDLDESDEINACSIVVNAEIGGRLEEWLVMFKNETHNHPTEIEPFGGAATCLGGAIRDPLSGRVYVYQAMRVTGSADPRMKIEDTIPGKLPQRKITTQAAAGYSSYGNQIGLATGQVAELYHPGYLAKRMEIGAVVGAAPRQNVRRQKPAPGDRVILLGGRTGRDGCGGATGSSKEHTEESLLTCGAEVQKGNPPTERKIQRLFRNPKVSRLIKKCNDFGAGGVAVAIGELADGLEVNLDLIPKKYEGLDGTELAISESQERMALVVAPADLDELVDAAREENLEATPVAEITAEPRLKMIWRGKTIVSLSREFLNSNGAPQHTKAHLTAPEPGARIFTALPEELRGHADNLNSMWISNLRRLEVCSQKGLVERFDSTIGAGTVLMPFGGKRQLSPAEGMVAKLPALDSDTTTGTIMTFGYNPRLAKWSPFHGALYAIVEAVAKVVALGGDYRKTRLTLQEYFEKLGKDPVKWGQPFAALLGAYYAQLRLETPAIGGKDSMSGAFKDLTVPPTLVAFALTAADVRRIISTEFKQVNSQVILLPLERDADDLPDFEQLKSNFGRIHQLATQGKILAAYTVKAGGVAEAITKMCFGNYVGFKFHGRVDPRKLFTPDYGTFVLEIAGNEPVSEIFQGLKYQILGATQLAPEIFVNEEVIDLDQALSAWEEPLEPIFPSKTSPIAKAPKPFAFTTKRPPQKAPVKASVTRPRIFMPVFPGTNCEYDTAKAFEKAGGVVDLLVIRNLAPWEIEASIEFMVRKINNSQIIMLPGGFSGGDEPDGSGKFIATAFRNPRVKEAVTRLLKERDGLILGICNGFQALIKLGLVPYGEIRDIDESSPTLTFNTIGRHVSCLVRTKVVSTLSPWFNRVKLGDIHTIPVSHGEGRFVASPEVLELMEKQGQIATQYVDLEGNPTYDIRYNPNGSVEAIEGITSPDGRILGKMGHSERIGANLYRNVPGEKDQKIFEAGVEYFR